MRPWEAARERDALRECERAADADAQQHLVGRTSAVDESCDVIQHEGVDVRRGGEVGHAGERLRRDDRGEVGGRDGRAVEDADGRGVIGIAERRAHHEAVELGFRQPVRARLLDRVLRGEHEEGHTDLTRDAVDRDLSLLHDLQERRLRLRARAVDLVGEDDVGEDGPGVEFERTGLLVVDRDAGDIAREQVGSELDARVRPLNGLRDSSRERGLAGARNVLEQDVPVAEHRGQDEFDDVALAQDGALDVVGDLRERLREPGRLLLRDGHVPVPLSVDRVRGRCGQGPGGTAGLFGSQDAENVVLAGERPQAWLQLTDTVMPSTSSAPIGTAQVSGVWGSSAPAPS